MCSAGFQVIVISYEMLLRSLELVKGIKFDLLVCDEACVVAGRAPAAGR
jgi:SNF2 family DNA or RNA helicase